MKEQIEVQRQNLVTTLQRMRRQASSKSDDGGPNSYSKQYAAEIAKYENMKEGGDGGQFRDSEFSIRQLHFASWNDSDFQLLLEAVGETPVIDDNEWELKFGAERGWLSKLFGKSGRPK